MRLLAKMGNMKNIMKCENDFIHLNYENISIRMLVSDFYIMVDMVEDVYSKTGKNVNSESEWEGFQIQSRGLNLNFSYEDFLCLRSLLQIAKRGIKLNRTLEKYSENTDNIRGIYPEEIHSNILC